MRPVGVSLLGGQGVSSVLWVRFPGVQGVGARTRTLKDSHFLDEGSSVIKIGQDTKLWSELFTL